MCRHREDVGGLTVAIKSLQVPPSNPDVYKSSLMLPVATHLRLPADWHPNTHWQAAAITACASDTACWQHTFQLPSVCWRALTSLSSLRHPFIRILLSASQWWSALLWYGGWWWPCAASCGWLWGYDAGKCGPHTGGVQCHCVLKPFHCS